MDMNQETKVTVIDDRLRQEEAETLCRWAAARAGVIVVAPLLGTMALIANDVYLVIKLGSVYEEEIGKGGRKPAEFFRSLFCRQYADDTDPVCSLADTCSCRDYLCAGTGRYRMAEGR